MQDEEIICHECGLKGDDTLGSVNNKTGYHYMCRPCNKCGLNSDSGHKLGHVNTYTGFHFMCRLCKIFGLNSDDENHRGHVNTDVSYHYMCRSHDDNDDNYYSYIEWYLHNGLCYDYNYYDNYYDNYDSESDDY